MDARLYPRSPKSQPKPNESKDDIDLQDAYGRSALAMSAYGGPPSAINKVNELLDAGANPNSQDRVGLTPFLNACYGSADIAIVQRFLAHEGTDLEAKDFEGKTFLHYAANGAHVNKDKELDIVPLLLSHYKAKTSVDKQVALVNQKDNQGLTPLHLACMKGCSQTTPEGRVAVIKALMDCGAKPTQDLKGRTPSDLAVLYKLDGLKKFFKR